MYQAPLPADAVPKEGGKCPDHVRNISDIVLHGHSPNRIQRVIQEMRIDLCLQRRQLRLFIKDFSVIFSGFQL